MKTWGETYVGGYMPRHCIRDMIIISCLILLAILFPYLSYIGYLKPACEPSAIWFQRSGSLSVLLSLTAEYIINRVFSFISPTGQQSSITENMRLKYQPFFLLMKYLGAICAIVGTIIWGYGDLILINT